MAPLRLHLLGPFQAELDGYRLVGLAAKARALMAYLAVEAGRAHRRADLAELLWPERPPGVALANLRYTLRDLRTALRERSAVAETAAHPPLLLSTRDTLQLDPGNSHWLDAAEFLDLLDLTGLKDLSGLERAGLERAVALYRGPFLDDLSVDSAAYEEWVLFRREQFERQMITALERLASLHEAAGRPAEAIPHLRRILALDSWDETAHRQLMRLLAIDGQRPAALAQYETCRRVLTRELGLAPAAETVALAEEIRQGRLAGATATARDPAPGTPAPSRAPHALFVGRKQELDRMDQFLQRALAGRAQIAFVTGEAGAGKTALLAEFVRRSMARHSDLVAAGGDCTALAGPGDPYLPFRDILGLLTGEIEGRQAAGSLSPEQAGRLAALLPVTARALFETGPDLVGSFLDAEPLASRLQAILPAGSALRAQLAGRADAARRTEDPSTGGQAALFDQITRLLQAVARQQPLLLTLDNLQWADPGSASLIFHLGRRLGASRVLIVGAYRPALVTPGVSGTDDDGYSLQDPPAGVAATHRHPLEAVLHELRRDRGDIEVCLDEANDQAFVEAILDSEPNRLGAAFRQTLAQHTAGNPLFTVELLRSLEERGSLVPDATGHWVESSAPDWERLPVRVEAVIAERVGRLPQTCQEVLSAASVEGVEFSAEVAACVLNIDRAQVVRQLGGPVCQQHRLAQPTSLSWLGPASGRLSRYRFRHHLFRSYLYWRLDEAQRASWHEAVGTALEGLHGDGAGAVTPQLAWHFERAGLAAKAAGYLGQSGERAARLSAHEEAIALFRRGLALLQTLPASPERDRQELAILRPLALGPSLMATQGWGAPEHLEACERAAHLCRELGETGHLPAILHQIATLHQVRGAPAQAGVPGARPPDGAPSPQQAREQLELGRSLMFLAESAAARVYLERSLAACLALPGSRVTSSGVDVGVACLGWLALILSAQGWLDQARDRSHQALARAQALEDPASQAFAALVAEVHFHVLRREPEPVRQAAQRLLEMAQARGLAFFDSATRIPHGWARAWLGEVEAGVEEIRQGLAAAPLAHAVASRPFALTLYADACLAACHASNPTAWARQGLAVVDEALDLMERSGFRQMEAEVWRIRGELMQAAGATTQEIEGCFLQAIDIAQRRQAPLWELRAAVRLVRLLDQGPLTGEATDLGESRAVATARQVLVDAYARFSEGFDAPDLVEARALLEPLA